MGPAGYAVVILDDTVAARIADDLAAGEEFASALAAPLLAAQLADLAAGDDTVVTDDELVLPWGTFSRWVIERREGGYAVVIARPGIRSTLAWSPELGELGPDTDALAELREALAGVHPALGECELQVT